MKGERSYGKGQFKIEKSKQEKRKRLNGGWMDWVVRWLACFLSFFSNANAKRKAQGGKKSKKKAERATATGGI